MMVLAGIRIAPLATGRTAFSFRLQTSLLQSRVCALHYRSALEPLAPSGGLQLQRIVALPFSTPSVAKQSSTTTAVATNQGFFRRLRWRIIARVAYYFRIPFLVLSVYGIGYQQGIMDYSREPQGTESKLMDTTLASVGCVSPEDREKVLIAREGGWRNLLAKFRSDHPLHKVKGDSGYDEEHRRMVMLHNASGVGEKIVKAARSYVKEQLITAVKEGVNRMPPEVVEDENRLYHALQGLEDVNLWSKAQKHVEGTWRFVLIPSPVPNAFVSEILPHRIFITTSMFEAFIESQDELALVLGHEISHLILGHSSQRNSIETMFRTIEILLLSMDPTEGILSLAFMSFLASVRSALGAVYSRENEREADELGIKLTAMACFDTHEATNVFYKMHLHDVESGRKSSQNKVGGLVSFFDSHPPTDERFRTLQEESGEENKSKYDECSTLKSVFWEAIGGGKEKQ
mmetsp:Transcript_14795/g.25260  ORF Transcript_14795/g.25260 Transcript_14795/m.25260 type:complete len:460 (-) Transcript_14795:48-1427(-)